MRGVQHVHGGCAKASDEYSYFLASAVGSLLWAPHVVSLRCLRAPLTVGLCTVSPWRDLLSCDNILPSDPWSLGEGSWGGEQPETPLPPQT